MPPPKALGEEGNEFQGDVEVHTGNKGRALLLRLTDVRAQTGCEKTRGSKNSVELQPLKDNAKIPCKYFYSLYALRQHFIPVYVCSGSKGFS